MSEYGYGVALLTDSKYGYAVHKNVMRLSLLRSPKSPDEHCDMGMLLKTNSWLNSLGHHEFKYAIFPHGGSFAESPIVIQEAFAFNVPLLTRILPVAAPDVIVAKPFIQVTNSSNVILDTVKQAEDSKEIIIRLYEACGGHARPVVRSSFSVKKVERVNLLEEPIADVSVIVQQDNSFSFTMKPFQVHHMKNAVRY